MDEYRLAISVKHADGRVTRWGADEVGSSIPTGLRFSTSIPGLFKDMSCSLLRRSDITYPDEAIYDDIRVYGPGGQVAWEGRGAQLPRRHGDSFAVTPGAIGWSAHLRDDPSFREIYVDRDLTRWGAVTSGYRLAVPTFTILDPRVQPDIANGLPTLFTGTDGGLGTTSKLNPLAFYDSGGIDIGSLYYAWNRANGNISSGADATYNWYAIVGSNDTFTGGTYDTTGDLQAAGPSSGTITASTGGRKFALVGWEYLASSSWSQPFAIHWSCLAVYGRHGLTKRGSDSATSAKGLYASDVLGDIVSRGAPLLRFTTGPDGSITPSTFVIGHLAFLDPTTPEDAISLVNGYHRYEWGVAENRTFFWRPPDPDRLTWKARLSDGAQIELEGDDANNIFNGVFVVYTDPSGRRCTVGPPGALADATDGSLVDASADNPVNAHGIPRRWGLLEISTTVTLAAAIQLGAIWLADHRLPSRRGTIRLTGLVEHPTEGMRPVWRVRAGDYITLADRPGDVARRIVDTEYDHDTRQMTLQLDNTAFNIDAILERLGVGLIGVI